MSHYHGLIMGETGSGKTFLARRKLAAEFRRAGVGVLAYRPEGHHWDEPNWQTHEADKFISMVNNSRQCAVFVEFSDAEVAKFDTSFTRLGTWSRNLGHRCFFLAQRHTQVNPTLRDQCGFIWLFRVGFKTASLMAEEFVDRSLEAAPTLPNYHYFLKRRGSPAERCTP